MVENLPEQSKICSEFCLVSNKETFIQTSAGEVGQSLLSEL
jgi:hypothetical protein